MFAYDCFRLTIINASDLANINEWILFYVMCQNLFNELQDIQIAKSLTSRYTGTNFIIQNYATFQKQDHKLNMCTFF
jgi:hypothetical protein